MKIKRTRIITVETHSVTFHVPGNSEKGGAEPSSCAYIDCDFAIVAPESDRPESSLNNKTTPGSRLRRVLQKIRRK